MPMFALLPSCPIIVAPGILAALIFCKSKCLSVALRDGLDPGSDDHLRAILDIYDLKRLTTQVGTSLLEILEKHFSYVDERLTNNHQ